MPVPIESPPDQAGDAAGDPEEPRGSGRRPVPPGLIGPFTARHLWILIGVLAIVAVVLVAITSSLGSAPSSSSGAAPTPGTSFYLLGEAGTGLEIGDRPPPFAAAGEDDVLDLDGNVVDLATLEGRPVWVVFWATWCPPCQQETPDLQRAWEAYEDTGLKVIAVDVQESDDIAADYAATYGLTYDIAVDRQGAAFRNWTVFGLPTHYFIGRDGLIKDRFFGPLTFEQMQERLDGISVPQRVAE